LVNDPFCHPVFILLPIKFELKENSSLVRSAYGILVGKPGGKRLLKRHRHRWEDNIKMDFREIGLESSD
jgi:hypothetical protein